MRWNVQIGPWAGCWIFGPWACRRAEALSKDIKVSQFIEFTTDQRLFLFSTPPLHLFLS